MVKEEAMIESRKEFLRRFVRIASAGLVALMLVGAVGCGGEEEEDEEEEDEEED